MPNFTTLPPMAKSGRTHVNQGVSFPPDLLADAKERAEKLGLAFSQYVQKCVERDLKAREPIVFEEKDPPRGKPKAGS